MKSEIKKLWTDALRSGEYEQGFGALRKNNTYCCLGVLCDLHLKIVGGQKWDDSINREEDSDKIFYYGMYDTGRSGASLPLPVSNWAGLNGNYVNDPKVFVNSISQNISEVNDSKEFDFNQIADIIENQL